jgi:toxin-antitoxin system PIN domain toxin
VILLDADVLIAGHRAEDARHDAVRSLLDELFASPLALAVPDLVLTAFVRITTNPRLFAPATSLDEALAIATAIRSLENCLQLKPGRRFWELFAETCRAGQARGPLVTDAYLAALAIEHGCELLSFDRDFARFPGLRWRPPVA